MPIDYKKYPKNWKSEIVPFVLNREIHRCKFCDLKNGTTVKSLKIRIQNEQGKYKYKTFWFRDESDFKRALRLTNGDFKEVKIVLTIAHLDHDENNHEVKMERLAALCQYCHLEYDVKEKYRRAISK